MNYNKILNDLEDKVNNTTYSPRSKEKNNLGVVTNIKDRYKLYICGIIPIITLIALYSQSPNMIKKRDEDCINYSLLCMWTLILSLPIVASIFLL